MKKQTMTKDNKTKIKLNMNMFFKNQLNSFKQSFLSASLILLFVSHTLSFDPVSRLLFV